MNYTPREVFKDFHQANWRRAIIVAARRTGKEQPVTEPVLTPTGFVPMGQIKPSTLVIGMDGKPHKVLDVFPQGIKPIYKITFSDGSYTRAGLEHLWRVYKNFRANRNQKTIVLSTKDLLKDYKKPHPNGGFIHLYCLPQQEIVHFNKKNTLPLHPYLLGVLLGDGSFYNQTPCIANPIPEIRQKLIDFGYDAADIKIYGNNGTPHYNIRGIFQIIKDMGLCGQCYNNKFVPEEYLFASPEDRMLLLQGLMDTDGSVSEDGKSSFSNCNNNLIEAVCWLARSLGMIATISTTVDYRTKSAPCKNVSINSQVCPFLAEPNKLKRWKPSRNCKTRRIVDISYDGEEEAQCILVDSEDHTYLTRDFIITHNTFASVAELLKRAYNGPTDGQYLFISPLAEQSMANTIGMFARFDNGEGYIVKCDKTNGVISLANGAQITLGGARTAEKYRGRYLNGCFVDELSQVSPEVISEVLLPCLADRNGWLAFLGTARVDDDYRLYKLYKEYKDDPNWFARMISIYDNKDGFTPERIKEIHEEHVKFCLASGMSMLQAEQSFNVEFECNFDFIDEGRPNMTAMFYNELQSLFDAKPPRLLDPADTNITSIPLAAKTAVFDISHSAGRDYTVATIVAETTTTPIVTNIVWENNQPLQYWFDYLRSQGIRNVALPFDAATVNKETMLSLVQTFKREGFNVVRIKRLLREEQIENGRWILNNARFSKDCIPGLSQLGLFQEFTTRHGLSQDVVSSMLYAGQVLRKKHVKMELASKIKENYNSNVDAYNYGANVYEGTVVSDF